MANITLMGASYSDVPAVTLPQTGGGTVTFYEGGGGSSSVGTASATASSAGATSLSFSVEGEPIAFALINANQFSLSSGYYYISSIVYDGSSHEGTFAYYKSGGGSSRYVGHDSTHYSHTYSSGTLTVKTSASRSATGGAFYNTTYKLVYVY